MLNLIGPKDYTIDMSANVVGGISKLPDIKQKNQNSLRQGIRGNTGFMSLTILTKGQIIGQEDILAGRPRATCVKCISPTASVFKIKADDFLSSMKRYRQVFNIIEEEAIERDETTMEKLRDQVRAKKQYNIPSALTFNDSSKKNIKNELKNPRHLNIIHTYNLRETEDRLQDFRETIDEIVGCDLYDKKPKDMGEFDTPDYGKHVKYCQ